MLDLTYSDNIGEVIKNLNHLEKEQLPFAMSRAINRTTFEARDVVLQRMGRRFTVRERSLQSKGGGRRALFVEASNKKQRVIQAKVGTPFWFFEDQEVGGTRTGKSGQGAWLPGLGARTRNSKEGRVASRYKKSKVRDALKEAGKYPRSRRSKNNKKAYAKQKPFVVNLKSGKRGVFIRKRRNSRFPIALLYTVTKSFRVAPRWHFREAIENLSDKKLRAYFIEEMQQALRTSRKGSGKSRYLEYLMQQEKLRVAERSLPSVGLGGGLSQGGTLDQLSQVARGLPGV